MNKDLIIIIQARMGSKRLPGKSMLNINGKPLISYLIDTIRHVNEKLKIVIATSELIENDVIRRFAEDNQIDCFSGSENNVASRFVEVIENNPNFKYFVRLCGDSPLFDVNLLKNGLYLVSQNEEFDIVTTKFNNAYPMGSNLEIFSCKMYKEVFNKFNSEEHFEHVTTFCYQHFEHHKMKRIGLRDVRANDLKYKLSVDTIEDFDKVNYLLQKMKFEPWNYSIHEKFTLIEEYYNKNNN
jgi:spore coat polysaccharide biosynthesis protein SpsF